VNPFLKRLVEYRDFAAGFFRSPKRLRNMVARLSETFVALAVFYWLGPREFIMDVGFILHFGFAAGVAMAAEFMWYEFFLEPSGLAGHYFERGPREGETFKYD